ncbi:DUF2510 domain-containing protein [Microlunatus speluncae]|uniref:DUF2510 domain-containing protein n=1 Tax=Microlunatus speluncae TaxID=2594267 RepID=UPI0012664C92|nr:DUF2510 domain-containing protein [Microlunatus speluncae]
MATPGWYPDPGGTPGAYRYWDGATWSAETTTDPRRPSPGGGPADDRPSRSRAGYLIIAALVVVVLITIGAIFVVRNSGAGSPITDRTYPSSTVTGWDDSRPTESPSSDAPQSPSGTPSGPGGEPVPCPLGDPNRRESHPADGRVYGGNLSFPVAGNFQPAAPEPRMSFAYDVTQQYLPVNGDPGWIAQLAVGRLLGTDFPGKPEAVADSIMQCAVTTRMYLPYNPTRKDLRSEAITISGQPGWLIESDIVVDQPGLPFPGDKVIFVIIPDGADWGLFFGAVPIGNADLTNQLSDVVRSLTAS